MTKTSKVQADEVSLTYQQHESWVTPLKGASRSPTAACQINLYHNDLDGKEAAAWAAK